jgi:murein DD-endopeptidase MepM/ murein hydrolase activator NlpD
MRLARLLPLALTLLAGPSLAADPFPPQLAVSFLATPAPIVQDGSTRLVYEMQIVSYSKSSYVLDAVEAKAGETAVAFRGSQLEGMIRRFGFQGEPVGLATRTIEGGHGALVFLMLNLGKAKAPPTIDHTLRILDDKGELHEVPLAPLGVSGEQPIVVGAPLRGQWMAGDSVSNAPDAAHRRAVMVLDGRAYAAQRFAIDWVQVQTIDGVTTTWKGPEDKNDSYFCYDQPIYSVADGKVVGAADGAPENVPHSQTYAIPINFNNAAGNHVVVEIAPRRYVLYAHMRPGTVAVKAGDVVRAGQVLGHVGNTGSSAEPHLHMHIDDEPSFLGGNGVPYEFASGEESGPVEANVSSPTAVHFGPIGPQHPFTDDYPGANALVTFK